MSSNRRCVDDAGLVHYGDWAGHGMKNGVKGGPLYVPWCQTEGQSSMARPTGKDLWPEAKPKRANVTCLLCLWQRWKRRGGSGALLG